MREILPRVRCLLWLWAIVSISGFGGARSLELNAQPLPGESALMPRADTSLPGRLASITTDTGDFAPGHREFSRYETPDQCRAAVLWTDIARRRSWSLHTDSSRYQALEDTAGGAAIAAVAKACGAQVSPVVAQQNPSAMVKLALDQRDVPSARSWFAQVLRHPRSAVVDTLLQYSLNSVYPANLAAARAFLAALDSIGPAASVLQLSGRAVLLRFWESSLDTLKLRQTADEMLRSAHAAEPNTWSVATRALVDTAYRALIRLAWSTQSNALLKLAQQACQDNPGGVVMTVSCSEVRDSGNTQGLLASLRHTYLQQFQAPALQANVWFPVPGADTLVPKPGVVSLIVALTALPRGKLAAPNDEGAEPTLDAIRFHIQQWLTQYSGQALQITAVQPTHGHAVLSGLETPAAEAQTIRWFVQDYLHLPITVAVPTTVISHRQPMPDGRAIRPSDETLYGKSEIYFNYQWNGHDCYTLIDQHGALVLQTDDPVAVEEGLRALLRSGSLATSPAPHTP